jgi:hypothetical protein
MSTFAYGALTRKREESAPGTSTTGDAQGKPGIGTYADTLAALVPAEVLAAHAFVLTFTTKTMKGIGGKETTTVTDMGTLKWVWYALVAVTVLLYVLGHGKRWDRWDLLRVLIPPAAFAGWTMAQQVSAFTAVASWSTNTRYALVAVGTVALAAAAATLGMKADAKPAPSPTAGPVPDGD